jgi:Zn-dependent protease with chaperone function
MRKLELKLAFYLYIIPLLMIWVASLQWHSYHEYVQRQAQLVEWQNTLSVDPSVIIKAPHWFRLGHYSHQVMLSDVVAELANAAHYHVQYLARGIFSGLQLLFTCSALMVGVFLLAKMKIDSYRAYRSQHYMLTHLFDSWKWVSYLSLWHVGFILLATLMLIAYIVIMMMVKSPACCIFLLPLVGVVGGGTILFFHIYKALPMPKEGMQLLGRLQRRTATPGLWRWVANIADKVGAPLPDNIVIGIEQSFFVTSVPVTLKPEGVEITGRTLNIPLTYVSMLNEMETAAIIGHELGHFAHQDTENGQRLSSVYHLIEQKIALLSEQHEKITKVLHLPIWISLYFMFQFDKAYHHWSRLQEFAADNAGCSVAGKSAFASALLRVIALSGRIEQLLDMPVSGNILQRLKQSLNQQKLSLEDHNLESIIAHPYDTHPSTRARLNNLQIVLDKQLIEQATRQANESDSEWLNSLLSAEH